MRLRSPRVWIAILSAAGVLYVSVGYVGRESPGPLAAVHDRVPELTGWNSCAQCHGGWFGGMTESCLECHGDIGDQIGRGAGLHGALGKAKAEQCARCHSDHHGADFAMVNRQSFVQAGVPDRGAFDHAMVGFDMRGRHLEVDCAKCHVNADAAVLPEGGKRFGGLTRDCAACHEDVHEGRLARLTCAQCHGQEDWTRLHSEGHEEQLPLVGGHGDVQCRTCHAQTDARHSLEALGGGRQGPARTCRECHDSPHREEFVAGVGHLAAKPAPRACVVCHVAEHTDFRVGATVTPEQHAASGFPLDLPHDLVTCEKCHGEGTSFDQRYPGRGPDTCQACHGDPHGGQFDQSPFGREGCLGCHERIRWEPHAFTTEKHARTALPLDGRHLAAECAACHLVPLAEGRARPRVFRGTADRCEGCHADAHAGFFTKFTQGLPEERRGECARCHLTDSFDGVAEFDHGRWTGFAVRGAHAQSTCESCHPRAAQPDEAGRTLGRVAAHFGPYESCATCHRDPHEGEFDKPGLPRGVAGKASCARCHVETSFRAFPQGFDHGAWTGFPLEGEHEKAGCAACHEPLREPTPTGRTWGRSKGVGCADCHADPHAGQFRVDGVTDCQRCHRSSTSFEDLAFRHNFDSRFRLGKAHAGLACGACHKPFQAGGREVVRYRPLGRECSDCHDPQDDPFRRKRRDR